MSLLGWYQTYWMFKSHREQRLAWNDAAEMRIARRRAETLADMRMQAMLDANPSGQLGDSQLNDLSKLKDSGLL
jgi:hypothetical protein